MTPREIQNVIGISESTAADYLNENKISGVMTREQIEDVLWENKVRHNVLKHRLDGQLSREDVRQCINESWRAISDILHRVNNIPAAKYYSVDVFNKLAEHFKCEPINNLVTNRYWDYTWVLEYRQNKLNKANSVKIAVDDSLLIEIQTTLAKLTQQINHLCKTLNDAKSDKQLKLYEEKK